MKLYPTHVVFASKEVIPNITPLLDQKTPPKKVIICVSNTMEKEGAILKFFLDKKKIPNEIFPLGNANRFNELKETFLLLSEMLEKELRPVALNISGGTKTMTVSAQIFFGAEDDGVDCIYVITEKDQIIILDNPNPTLYEIADKLSLKDYFEIHGYQVNSMKKHLNISTESRHLFNQLLGNHDKYSKEIPSLNYLAKRAESSNSITVLSDIRTSTHPLLDLFKEHGAIYYYDDKKVIFRSEEDRDFCKGFWLEDATYLALKEVDNAIGLQDFACSVEIESHSHTKNEIDAAFLYDNTLYIIECKTSMMREKGADVLYKLDTIKGYAGVLTKPLLVSLKHLRSYDKERARDLKIKTIEGNALNNMSHHILKAFHLEKKETSPLS